MQPTQIFCIPKCSLVITVWAGGYAGWPGKAGQTGHMGLGWLYELLRANFCKCVNVLEVYVLASQVLKRSNEDFNVFRKDMHTWRTRS